MEHYFSKDPQVKSHKKTFIYHEENITMTFSYDHGVFSMGSVDKGSELLVRTFVRLNPSLGNQKVLDLGTGYGFIGVYLKKKLSNIELTMSDINNRAIELAKENCATNSVKAHILQSDGFENIVEKFDVIFLNPPIRTGKEKVYNLLGGCHEHLLEAGQLWIVVRVKQGAKSMAKFLEGFFSTVETVEKKGGYHIIKCLK
ncbi:class I SAM-dependent methyltransferase [Alkalicella caledoniensis]|uniref:Class I SAM-dependent methyltransferase n=1 Tax=Alkalicella caledoniensis TaxID=2731377 RepID=A0A7G9W4D0_ALKCA|nr:methyltransferase [Alkalicella caledoniensis]QNO13542.1 class I SAM-dependent methyltransferase [Alkalicella caledoniensis]